MEDKAPSTPRTEGSLDEGRQFSPPRIGPARVQQCCSSLFWLILELWRRIRLEVVVEWPLLKQRWKVLLFGIVMQYVHGIFTQLAHRMHQPQVEPLHDVGFDLTPELGPDNHWVSETIFGLGFAMFVLWTFSPFLRKDKRFYTVVLWTRLLMVLVVCQALRIVTFSVTQLPGPSFHCRANAPSARRPWPAHWSGHLVVDVGRQVSKSCGDLIFSSHTTFILTGILAYNEYGFLRAMKAMSWLLGVVLSILIVASRKHYTVDVIIAWYTVPLVFYMMYRRWTTRRPMSDFIGDAPVPAFDDVDGGEMELEEVLIERSSCGSGPLFGCMDGSGHGITKMMPRIGTLKISVRAPLADRHLGAVVGLGQSSPILGTGGTFIGTSGNHLIEGVISKPCETQVRTSSGTLTSVVRGLGRPAVQGLDVLPLQQHQLQRQQPGQQVEEELPDRWTQGTPTTTSSLWFLAPNT
ncbi:hypothetical protein VOLCADRAFT_84244 [Volvox carteri f. nagariensis]|uniref:MTF1733 n=2 Tax=Volvox carteri f. nagariensis TaxID=3068 RepID=D8UGZ3_VOLCA|nr:uncharacterized protein VOLCADRAFT_84244 [Volvox carteri f. nagariensis]ADI46872.1 MTF1733 [Volvox carteri f. nagariensis]EFJ40981.1 hypothetical protein VOLCADRAFT_84244 [Volvox carteri f. nagariensis]|eukprot:XP_002957955.1 hypothetical protein VOLCADRAFT_84244 [Volvox carteri f. nagariensis]